MRKRSVEQQTNMAADMSSKGKRALSTVKQGCTAECFFQAHPYQVRQRGLVSVKMSQSRCLLTFCCMYELERSLRSLFMCYFQTKRERQIKSTASEGLCRRAILVLCTRII